MPLLWLSCTKIERREKQNNNKTFTFLRRYTLFYGKTFLTLNITNTHINKKYVFAQWTNQKRHKDEKKNRNKNKETNTSN